MKKANIVRIVAACGVIAIIFGAILPSLIGY